MPDFSGLLCLHGTAMREGESSPLSLDDQRYLELLHGLGTPANSKTLFWAKTLKTVNEAEASQLKEQNKAHKEIPYQRRIPRGKSAFLQVLSMGSETVSPSEVNSWLNSVLLPVIPMQEVSIPTEDEVFIGLCYKFLFPLNLKHMAASAELKKTTSCKELHETQQKPSDWFFYKELVDQLRQTVDITPEVVKEHLRQFMDHIHSTMLPDQTTIAACIAKPDLHQTEEILTSELTVQILGNLLEHFQTTLRNRILKAAANCKDLDFNLSTLTKSMKSRRYTRRQTLKSEISELQSGAQTFTSRSRNFSLFSDRKQSLEGQLKDSFYARHSCYALKSDGLQGQNSSDRNRVFVVLDLFEVLRQQYRKRRMFYSTALPLLIFAMRVIVHRFFSSCHPTVTGLQQWKTLVEELDQEVMSLVDPQGVHSRLAPLQSSIKGSSLCMEMSRKAHPPLRSNFRDLSLPLRAVVVSKSTNSGASLHTLDSDQKQALLKHVQNRLYLKKRVHGI